jgi:sugar lactone lactonase YvrE
VGFLAFPNAACGTPPFRFVFPAAGNPLGVGAFDRSGLIWVATNPLMNSNAPSNPNNPSEIFVVDPNVGEFVQVIPLASGSQVNGMVLGPDNAIWFTDGGLNEIGRVDQNGIVSHFPLKSGKGLQPQGITVGTDGALWFTELHGNRIGRITTSGAITETNVPAGGTQPNGIIGCQSGNPCPAPSTRAVFFTEPQRVGKVTF